MPPRPTSLWQSPATQNPVLWGQSVWDTLFTLAAHFPHEHRCDDDFPVDEARLLGQRRAFEALLKSLTDLLPCPVCQEHFREYVHRDRSKHLRAALRNREALMLWLHGAKQEVNRRQGRRGIAAKTMLARYLPPCAPRKK